MTVSNLRAGFPRLAYWRSGGSAHRLRGYLSIGVQPPREKYCVADRPESNLSVAAIGDGIAQVSVDASHGLAFAKQSFNDGRRNGTRIALAAQVHRRKDRRDSTGVACPTHNSSGGHRF